jgi:hypothetical protein
MNLFGSIDNMVRRCLAVAVAMSGLMLASAARADLIELTNGDHYRGVVVAMTVTNMEFISEIQGRVFLPRAKIAQITLHDVTPRPVATHAITNEPLILSGPSTPTVVPGAAAGAPGSAQVSGSASAVLEQMRQQGVDPKLVNQVQEKIFGQGSPEASSKFNQLMGGLMSGQISVKDIQAQAQQGIAQIKAAKKELGPEAGEMLDGYLGILEKFVQEANADSTPPISQTPPARVPTK